jgi:FixJ family two-component response regulator
MERFDALVLLSLTISHCGETMNITIKPSSYSERECVAPVAPCIPEDIAAPAEFTVFIVDDDHGVLKSLTRLIGAAGYTTQSFSSAQQFLAEHDRDVAGCLVLDLRMPGIDGRELQAALRTGEGDRSIIFVSGTTDAPTIVDAMKAGAIDFLIKPVNCGALLAAIETAVERQKKSMQKRAELACIKRRLAQLTPREGEVLRHVISGRLNKQIAWDLGTVEKTIKVHRSRIMGKMGVRTIAELVRLTEQIGLAPCEQKESRSKNGPELFFGVGPRSERIIPLALHVA